MDKHPHIIGRQIFDIDFSKKEQSEVLQDKISFIFNSRLLDEMNQLFDKVIPTNRLIKLDTLQIDLGEISFDLLENELPNRFIQKMEEELRLIFLHDNAASTSDSEEVNHDDIKLNYLELLEYFLLNGTFPWWVSGTDGPTISGILEFLLLNSSLKVRELLMRIGQDYSARKRFVYQFTEQQIKYIIIILEPEEAEFIFDYQQNLLHVQKEVVLVKNEESDFKRAVWLLILTFLIVDKGSHFNRKEFVKSMLRNMAAHFNVDFSELLALFSAGLKSGSPALRNTDSLQRIILEISIDQDIMIERSNIPVKRSTEKNLPELSKNLEFLRYYFTFGSFPWWSDYLEQQSLEVLLANMLDSQPKTMAVLIRNVGQKQFSRRLIVSKFKEEILLSIVKVLEPDQTEFIVDYINEAKESNKRDSIIKVSNQELSEAIWEFVLEYLLVDRGSEFNRQMFLESNIRNLANRFNIKFSDLLVFLINSISIRHDDNNRHISLINDLRTLYKIRQKELGSPLSQFNLLNESQAPLELVESKNLRDVLYYWLKMGHYPWWAAEKYSSSAISLLIEQLIRESPTEAIVFFKFSGQSIVSRTRMLNQISTDVFIKLFRLLPDGNKAIRYTEKIISLFSINPLFKSLKRNTMDRVTLNSLWDMYIKNYYEVFKPGDFLGSFIINLSLANEISIKKVKLFLNSLVLDKLTRTHFNRIIRRLEENGVWQGLESSDSLFPAWSKTPELEFLLMEHLKLDSLFPAWSESPELELLLSEQLKSDSLNSELVNSDMILAEATYILRYFLQFNKLPEKYKQSSEISVNIFLKQLLILLHKKNAADLEVIINSENYDAKHVFRLYDIFSNSNSIEENIIKVFLKTKFEKNILLFIRQNSDLGFTKKNLIQLIDDLSKDSFSESKNILKSLLNSIAVSAHLAQLLTDSMVFKILELETTYSAQIKEEIRNLNYWLLGLFNDQLEREKMEHLIRNFNLMIFGGRIKIVNINSYFFQLMEFIADNNYHISVKISSSIKETIKSGIEFNQLIIKLIPDLEHFISGSEKLESKLNALKDELVRAERKAFENLLSVNPDELKEDDLRQLKLEIKEQQQEEIKKSTSEILANKDSIYIQNAGLVILHPFLSTYFNRLDMFKDGDFINSEYKHRAVHLLQYLAYGTENNEEHELVLNKILCNIPIDEPTISGIVLTDLEKQVSAELINAVLIQWEKLKNTSPESFQASFIQRQGALSRIEENWNLKVETRGYDVLLNTMPWGLGMVKTSWMTEFIYVEWI